MGTITSTPLKKISQIQLVFRNIYRERKSTMGLQKKTTLSKLIKYIESHANLFYHHNDATFTIQYYSKLNVQYIEIIGKDLIVEGLLSIDKICFHENYKNKLTQENYKKWLGGSNGAFETSWDDRPFEHIFLENPEVHFM